MSRQSYAQSLFKLGLSPGDPIVEVGLGWAAGDRVPAKDIRIAIRSAEHHQAGKDKMLRQRMSSVLIRLRKYLAYAEADESRKGPKVYGERSLTTQPRANPHRRSRRNPRDKFFVHDPYMGEFLDFGSVRSAARYAKNRFGCDPAADCVFIEHDEALVPIGSLRNRKNPYTTQRPAKWASMTRKEKKAWNRKHWTSSPSGVSKKRVRIRSRRGKTLNEIMDDDLRGMKALLRKNPRVAFRTCKGKRVAFKAKARRKGKTPSHLKPYLFKKGHRGRKRCR